MILRLTAPNQKSKQQKTREQIAIERILTFQPDSVGFSGGKDSVVVDHLMQQAGLSYQGFMNLTTVDPKIHLDFVRQHFPHIQRLPPAPGVSMYSLIRDNGLPSRKIRFCCEHLKERIQLGTFVVFGIRAAEGSKRAYRPMMHYHPINKGVKVLNPIIDWSDRDVWSYIRKYDLPVSPLYLPPYNFRRVGCIGCPMANKSVGKHFRLFPEYQRYYIEAIRARRQKGFFQNFESAEDVFAWWISQQNQTTYFAQTTFCMDNF